MPKWEYAAMQVRLDITDGALSNYNLTVTITFVHGQDARTMLDRHELKKPDPYTKADISAMRKLNELGSEDWEVYAISEEKSLFNQKNRGWISDTSGWISREYHLKRQIDIGGK